MSLFFVDNSCDLEFEQIRKLGIECFGIPYMINNVEHSFTDDFDYEKFFSKVRKGVVLTTRPLTKKEYVKALEPALKNGDDIVYVYASEKLLDSSALHKAYDTLIKNYPNRKIELIDSKNFSAGLGLVALDLALKYRNGQSVEEISESSYAVKDKIATYMVVKSLENLKLNGVVDGNNLVGSTLNVNYIVAVDYDGEFKVVEKVAGRKKALSKLVQIVRQQGQNINDYTLIVTESQMGSDGADIIDKLKEYYGEEIKVILQKMSPTSTAIAGPGSVAIAFRVSRKLN